MLRSSLRTLPRPAHDDATAEEFVEDSLATSSSSWIPILTPSAPFLRQDALFVRTLVGHWLLRHIRIARRGSVGDAVVTDDVGDADVGDDDVRESRRVRELVWLSAQEHLHRDLDTDADREAAERDYLAAVARPSTWGSELEAVAFTGIFRVPVRIFVWSDANRRFELRSATTTSTTTTEADSIRLLFSVARSHYSVLLTDTQVQRLQGAFGPDVLHAEWRDYVSRAQRE